MLSDRQTPVLARLLVASALISLASCASDGDLVTSRSTEPTTPPGALTTTVATLASTSTTSAASTPVPRSLSLDIVGACNEALFFARSDDDTIAVSIFYDASSRATSEPTVVNFTLPDPRLSVVLAQGTALSQALCADMTNEAYSRTSGDTVTSGSGTLSINPRPASPGSCGERGGVHDELHIEGLIDRDGTLIEPIDISTDLIGCIV